MWECGGKRWGVREGESSRVEVVGGVQVSRSGSITLLILIEVRVVSLNLFGSMARSIPARSQPVQTQFRATAPWKKLGLKSSPHPTPSETILRRVQELGKE